MVNIYPYGRTMCSDYVANRIFIELLNSKQTMPRDVGNLTQSTRKARSFIKREKDDSYPSGPSAQMIFQAMLFITTSRLDG